MLWADRAPIEAAVKGYAADLRARGDVRRIVWYGSWITGVPGPRSDVDLCVIVDASSLSRRQRTPEYLPVGFPTGIDLVVFTADEWRRLPDMSPEWHQAIEAGIDV